MILLSSAQSSSGIRQAQKNRLVSESDELKLNGVQSRLQAHVIMEMFSSGMPRSIKILAIFAMDTPVITMSSRIAIFLLGEM